MRIILTGFMGSGKTFTGKKIASMLRLGFIDIDEVIAHKTGMNINDIFEKFGEQHFRHIEADCLDEALKIDETVIATGGGTPCYFNNMDKMLRTGNCIFINATESFIFQNLKNERSSRPLIKSMDDDELKSYIHKKLSERMRYYNRAHIIFNPGKTSLKDLINELSNKTENHKTAKFRSDKQTDHPQ